MTEVDTSIKSRATGAAAKLVAAHSAEHPLKLYAGWFCPFVQRAWMVLQEKAIPYQYVEINPYQKSPEFLALNPRGLVPTLAVPHKQEKKGDESGDEKKRKGQVELKPLYESTIICEYLDEAFADEGSHGARLLPTDPYERARCRIWIDHVGAKIVAGFYKLLQHTPEKSYSLEQARRELHDSIKTFVREMMDSHTGGGDGVTGGPWFLGSQFSLVDVSLAPWAKRLWLIDHYKRPGGVGIPAEGEGDEDEAVWARWRVWFNAIIDRQSVSDTWSDEEDYVNVYKRYAEDTTNSLVGQATRKGEKLP